MVAQTPNRGRPARSCRFTSIWPFGIRPGTIVPVRPQLGVARTCLEGRSFVFPSPSAKRLQSGRVWRRVDTESEDREKGALLLALSNDGDQRRTPGFPSGAKGRRFDSCRAHFEGKRVAQTRMVAWVRCDGMPRNHARCCPRCCPRDFARTGNASVTAPVSAVAT